MGRLRLVALAVTALGLASPAALAWSMPLPQPTDSDTSNKTIDLRPKFVKGQEVKFRMTIRSRAEGGPAEGDEASRRPRKPTPTPAPPSNSCTTPCA
jgi:hypothetical protein